MRACRCSYLTRPREASSKMLRHLADGQAARTSPVVRRFRSGYQRADRDRRRYERANDHWPRM